MKAPIAAHGIVFNNINHYSLIISSFYHSWYKLLGKPDKENKKPEKERGDVEVKIDFLVKPKTGSVVDLSKTKEKSLSLKNLKDKSLTIKHSIGDKFKAMRGSKKSKFAGENQVNNN